MPASSSNHDSHLNKILSVSPSHISISSGPLLAIDEQSPYSYVLQSDAENSVADALLSRS